MEKKRDALFYLLVVMLFMACIVPLFAGPLSSGGNSASENQEPTVQFGQDQVANREARTMKEQDNHGRMGIEVNDYPGSGANNRHDPKTPGTPGY